MNNMKELSQVMFTNYPDCVGVQELAQMLGIKRTKTYELQRTELSNQLKSARTTRFQSLMLLLILWAVNKYDRSIES